MVEIPFDEPHIDMIGEEVKADNTKPIFKYCNRKNGQRQHALLPELFKKKMAG